MRKAVCGILAACGYALLVTGDAVSQEPTRTVPRKVVATATARAHAVPDAARLTFVVTTTTELPGKKLVDSNEQQVKKIKDALAALPLDKAEMQVQVVTGSVSNVMGNQQVPGGPRVVQGRQLQSIIAVRRKRLSFPSRDCSPLLGNRSNGSTT